MESILLVEDRAGLRQVYAKFLRAQDYVVVEAASAEDALKALSKNQFSLILTDYMLPGANGLDLLKRLREGDSEVPVIVMTAFGEVKLAVEATKAGAFDFLEKPVDLEYLKIVVARALDHQHLSRHREHRADRGQTQETIIGQAECLKKVLGLVEKVAPTEANCLLLGESGVGKELFARQIHQQSRQSAGELISINCASIPAELMESELFGHEKGAFTGAVARKLGLVEAAAGGTLFLDEIGELPLDLQPKLLRFIQSKQFYRVGGSRMCTSNARIICATNRDLAAGVREGWFREDLYYRLAAFPIAIPPLRDRLEDLDALVEHFLACNTYNNGASPELLKSLKRYHWPGNVRELENLVDRAMILAGGAELNISHFPHDLQDGGGHVGLRFELDLGRNLKENLKRLEVQTEKEMIRLLMREHKGNRERVAACLGYSVKTLYNRMKSFELELS